MNDLPLNITPAQLESRILDILRSRSDAVTEYDLIQQLRDEKLFRIDTDALLSADLLMMYRIHFTLFHVLYQLRNRLRKSGQSDLDLSPIAIRLTPYLKGSNALAEHDSLYTFYMDLENMHQVSSDEVEEMLGRFWARMENTGQRAEALRELDLQDPVDETDIKKKYRQLVMRHHPDRGGSKEKLQSINAAMSILLNSFSAPG